jgi:uncharacterized protein (TIGR02646 family)
MRAITKGNEPACLTQHRATAHSDYGNYGGKPALRQSLITEQRGLCCYCMSRVQPDGQTMKIEHWRSQRTAAFTHLQLIYSNLLGACNGGENGASEHRHCDTLKGDQALLWNPADPAHAIESRIKYKNDGQIFSDDAQFNVELNDVLGLNGPFLKNNRKNALKSMLDWWQLKKPNRGQLQSRINKIDNGAGQIEQFSPVAIWFLKRKLAA